MARALLGKHPRLVAKHTGVPLKFLQGIWTLYLALTSNHLTIDPDKLMAKYLEVKRIWHKAIPWYPLNPSVHRIFHIPQMIRILKPIAPTIRIGMLSEEAHESVNKVLKAFQIAHARQDTLEHRNLDVYHRMVARSDPFIHSHLDSLILRNSEIVVEEHYPPELLELCEADPENEE